MKFFWSTTAALYLTHHNALGFSFDHHTSNVSSPKPPSTRGKDHSFRLDLVSRDDENQDTFTEKDTFYSSSTKHCNYSLPSESLENLPSAPNPACGAFYSLKALLTMLDKAYASYGAVNDGYDEQFKYYQDYITKVIPDILTWNVMFKLDKSVPGHEVAANGPGMKFFDCRIGNKLYPCTDRKYEGTNKDTKFELKDRDGFYKAVADAGISPDWVDFGETSVRSSFDVPRLGKQYSTYKCQNFPVRNQTMVVPNPKDIVAKAIAQVPELRLAMWSTLMEMMLGMWSVSTGANPAQVYSIPVLMLVQGLENMEQAKSIAKKAQEEDAKAEEEKRKNIILLIVSVVLIFVPVVGAEAASAMGLATLARTIVVLGELGNGAFAIYDTVKNPEAAAVNVVGMLLGIGSFAKVERTEKGLGAVAALRAAIKPETFANFGKTFNKNNDILQDTVRLCSKKF